MAARKLKADELERYRAVLLHMRKEVAGDIGGLEKDAFENDGERASLDNPADLGSDRFAQEFSLELLARDEKTLGEIDAALDRLDAGTFGRCEACEANLPKLRLNAVPHARNCVDCQRELERAR